MVSSDPAAPQKLLLVFIFGSVSRFTRLLLFRRGLTFTLEALPDEPPQHLPAVVAEGRSLVGVDVQSVGSYLKVLRRGQS